MSRPRSMNKKWILFNNLTVQEFITFFCIFMH